MIFPIRHIEEDCNVPMYKTNIPCIEAGIFHGKMVVSMRPIPQKDVVRAAQVTSRFPAVHGGPIHIGDPGVIGVSNIHQPDFGDAVTIREGEVPGILGLWSNASIHCYGNKTCDYDYACTRTYVYNRYSR